MESKVLYYVLCFRGYRGVGAKEIIEFEPSLETANVLHLMERVPKLFVDAYGLGKEQDREDSRDSGYCTLGLILKPGDIEKVRELLEAQDRTADEDFILCPVMQEHSLTKLVETWDDVFESKEVK